MNNNNNVTKIDEVRAVTEAAREIKAVAHANDIENALKELDDEILAAATDAMDYCYHVFDEHVKDTYLAFEKEVRAMGYNVSELQPFTTKDPHVYYPSKSIRKYRCVVDWRDI